MWRTWGAVDRGDVTVQIPALHAQPPPFLPSPAVQGGRGVQCSEAAIDGLFVSIYMTL